MNAEQRVIAEKFLARLMPYIQIKDSGALIEAIHTQLEYFRKQNN